MSLAILFHFLCAQHVSDINVSIIRSLRLYWCVTTSVVLFSVRCLLEIWCGWVWVVSVLQSEAQLQQHSHKLLMMDILMSETCWAHKKWNKIASDIKLVFHSSTMVENRLLCCLHLSQFCFISSCAWCVYVPHVERNTVKWNWSVAY